MKPKGLDKFLNRIQCSKNKLNSEAIRELELFIEESRCEAIRFEKMSMRALGISKTDECILNNKVLEIYPEYMLYVILHEVSHQYQYKKHGKDIALEIYASSTDLDTAAQKLLWLEKTADRLAIKKMKSILNAAKITPTAEIKPRYLNLTDTEYLKKHILEIREDALQLGLKTIEDINNHIYRKIAV